MNGTIASERYGAGRDRRDFLQRAGRMALWMSCMAMPAGRAMAVPPIPRRIVVMDWPLTETLLALGVVPVGVSAPEWYRREVVEPLLPSSVVDVGLLYAPNYEVLEELAPDLMIITPGHAPDRPLLERLAPTLTLGRYESDSRPFPVLRTETLQMARAIGRANEGDRLLESTDRVLDGVRARLAQRAALLHRPVMVAELVDDRHVRVYGAGSLFDAMLSKIGVVNAANQAGQQAWSTDQGDNAVVPMQRLFELPQAALLLTGDFRSSQRTALEKDAMWQALPSLKGQRVAVLPVIASNGGLVSMQRFVLAVEKALSDIAGGRGGLG
jgi:ferric hydroxamate transport system substrate-binding protein